MPIDPTPAASDYTTYIRQKADIVKNGTVNFASSLFKSAVFTSGPGKQEFPPVPPVPPVPAGDYGILTGFDGNELVYDLSPGTSDFTVELFFKYSGGSGDEEYIWAFDESDVNMYIDDDGYFVIRIDIDDYYNLRVLIPAVNTWYHVAVTRFGNQWYSTVNGATSLIGTATGTVNSVLSIGGNTDSSYFTTGSISNFRYTKRALYTQVGVVTIPSVPLTVVADTELLLLAKPGAEFADSSGNNYEPDYGTCTVVPGTITPFPVLFTDYGILTGFNENENVLVYDLDPGTSSFTVEMFVRFRYDDVDSDIWYFGGSGDTIGMYINGDKLQVRGLLNSTSFTSDILTITVNTWYHIALTRSANEWYATVNGVTSLIRTENGDFTDGSIIIGGRLNGDLFYHGFISNFRYTTRALYDEETVYPIPSLPLTAVANTELLLLGKPDAPLADSSGNDNEADGACGFIIGPISPFPVLFDDYGILTGFSLTKSLTYPDTLNPGEDDFTVELFFKYSGHEDGAMWYFNGLGLNVGMTIFDNNLYGVVDLENQIDQVILAPSQNTWYHVALTRSVNNWYATVNGVTSLLGTVSGTMATCILTVGDYELNDTPFTGSISNFRYTKRALYSQVGVGTIPSLPLTAVANTELLLLAKPGEPFVDSSSVPKTATGSCTFVAGPISPLPVQFQEYGILTGFSPTMKLVYTGLNPESSEFTVEMFLRTPPRYGGEVWAFNLENSTTLVLMRIENSIIKLIMYSNNTLITNQSVFTPILINTWYHVALTRSGNTFYAMVNGSNSSIVTASVDFAGLDLFVGAGGVGQHLSDGSISNFRYTKRALYTDPTYPIPSLPLTAVADTELLLLGKFTDPLGDSSEDPHTAIGTCDVIYEPIVV
jgi:hypothetical protein